MPDKPLTESAPSPAKADAPTKRVFDYTLTELADLCWEETRAGYRSATAEALQALQADERELSVCHFARATPGIQAQQVSAILFGMRLQARLEGLRRDEEYNRTMFSWGKQK